jgi:hypothetical protein
LADADAAIIAFTKSRRRIVVVASFDMKTHDIAATKTNTAAG